MACNPKCPYFPKTDNVKYFIDSDGVKRTDYKFICGYNSEVIKDWNKKCPKEKVKNNVDKH